MDAHRVDVLDRADDHAVVRPVTHDLELELLPSRDRLLDQDLADRARLEPPAGQSLELLRGGGDAGALATEDERRPDHHRQPDRGGHDPRLVHVVGAARVGDVEPDPDHRLLEQLTILGDADRVGSRPDQLDPPLVERTGVGQVHGQVQRRLTAEGGEHGIGALGIEDPLDDLRDQRLDVGRVREIGVGHDRGRVRVGQDHPVALLAEHPARLGPRVVELACLSDHDGPGADDQDRLEVVAARHQTVFLRWCGTLRE